MNDPQFGRPWWTRRGFLQGSAAVAAGIYGLPGRLGHAAEIPDQFDGSKFQLAGARAQSQIRRRAALRHYDAAAAFRRSPVRDDQHSRRAGLHVRQSDPARSARQRQDDHPRSGAQLGDRQGRQDLHLLLAQRRAVSRRRRADRRGREGDLRPHRQAAAGHQHPAQHPVQGGQRDQCARQIHRRIQAGRAAPAKLSSCWRSPAAGT